MGKMIRGLFLLPLLWLSTSALAQPTLSPQQTVEQLYHAYLNDEQFVYFGETGETRIISQRLVEELNENDRYILPGDEGFLDYDPMCGCQDFESPFVESIQATQSDATHAEVTVRFHPLKSDSAVLTLITLTLIAEGDRWRIDDVIDSDSNGVTLYQRLHAENQRMRASLVGLQHPQPQIFVQRVYAQLAHSPVPWTAMATPTRLQALIDYEHAEGNSGKTFEDPHTLEYINSNPLCGCSEGDFQKIIAMNVVEQNTGQAKIHVAYWLNENTPGERDIVLSKIENNWVIEDVILPGEGSLLQRLRSVAAEDRATRGTPST